MRKPAVYNIFYSSFYVKQYYVKCLPKYYNIVSTTCGELTGYIFLDL